MRTSFVSTLYLVVFFVLMLPNTLLAGELELNGVYRGSNIYVENPLNSEGNYCVTEVFINGVKMNPLPQASAFEIDLSKLSMDESVKIKIIHQEGCSPKVLNPNAIKKKGEFKFIRIEANDKQLLWETSGESAQGTFVVMKFEHNEWIEERFVDGKGSEKLNQYSYEAIHHSGMNKYRVKYIEVTGRIYNSDELSYMSEFEQVKLYPKRVSSDLNFTRDVKYEIMDMYGKVVKKGVGNKVDCSDLKSGSYYVSFDNNTDRFFKK